MRKEVMVIGLRRFVAVEKKTFDVVAEGRGVRIYKNGRGFQKSIFFQKEDVEWLLQSFKEFKWGKEEGGCVGKEPKEQLENTSDGA